MIRQTLADLHGENNATAEDKSAQSWKSTRPESKDTLVLKNLDHAIQAVLVGAAGLYRLHACLDSVDRHGGVDCDDTSETTKAKCADSAELLSRGDIGLGELLERCVTREPDSRVGSLAGCCRDKALEEAANALLLRDDSGTVKESTHARVSGFSVVDARCRIRKG
jgi:hypothetical protein